MPDFSGLGKMIVLMGLGLVLLGGLLTILGKWPNSESSLGWFGRLPGDIFIKRDTFTFYFPISTSIIISVVGSVLLYLNLQTVTQQLFHTVFHKRM